MRMLDVIITHFLVFGIVVGKIKRPPSPKDFHFLESVNMSGGTAKGSLQM